MLTRKRNKEEDMKEEVEEEDAEIIVFVGEECLVGCFCCFAVALSRRVYYERKKYRKEDEILQGLKKMNCLLSKAPTHWYFCFHVFTPKLFLRTEFISPATLQYRTKEGKIFVHSKEVNP